MSNERTGVLELTLGDSYIGSAYSPQVEVTDTDTGHEVAITYMSPEGIVTERFDVADGETGPQGPAGFSPTVTITDTPTGHTVTITDADGPHSYDVPNYAQEEQERQDAWDALSGEVTDAIGDAQTATTAATSAASSATSAATSANTAAQAATTAAGSATSAATSATSAAESANTAASEATTAAGAATSAATAADTAAADADTAAQAATEAAKGISSAADALMGDPSESMWAQRTSAGSGMARVESVQGATVAWNQMCKLTDAQDTQFGGTVTRVRSAELGNVILNGTAAATGQPQYSTLVSSLNITNGHKYYLSKRNDELLFYINVADSNNHLTSESTIFTAGADLSTAQMILVVPATGYTFNNYVCYPQLFDLTQMFGAGNEPTTVAEFERMFPEAYYPYSAPTLKPVTIAGIASTDAQGGELDSVEWETQTLRAAGSVADMLYSEHVDVRVGVVDLGTLTWGRFEHPSGSGLYRLSADELLLPRGSYANTNIICPKYSVNVSYGPVGTNQINMSICGWDGRLYVRDDAYTTAADFKAAMSGVILYYELATPTTTPISPALPMSYKVEQGGTESIIVPEGEISAAPVLTVAEGESAAELVMDALACIAAPDGPVATANHAINTYLTMGGTLYKVTQAIAVGETIAAGTNVTATTVMDELITRTA